MLQFIDDTALKYLTDYYWPGNVRELQNIIERAVLITDSNTIFPEHLPEGMKGDLFLCLRIDRKSSFSIEDYTKEFILRYQHSYGEQKLSNTGNNEKVFMGEEKKMGNSQKIEKYVT